MDSDIGHFDCVDMADVLIEAYELGRGLTERGGFPRLRFRQLRMVTGQYESGFLQRDDY